ncbi:TetR/AcrR family transcriptional regulator [Nocardia speluncae]|uniref:TetR/AcrR family transcriptional regulator n=1 Tax=Nocardia speluncae TaxID=419477 RepID=A0A846XLY3_9NOCA|nr:TetR/AcrR family transcriptional regulator [Nocardia speluncae]
MRADAVRNQQRIVEAARELFADRGLEITLDDVAEHAGVGVGTVYRRFANKTELISEVFERHLGEFADAAEASTHHPDPWLGLVQFVEYACRHLAINRGFSEVILELDLDTERFHRIRDRIKPAIAAIVERARAAGVLQPDIEPSDLFALVHMVDGFVEFAKPIDPEIWRRYMVITLNGIRADSVARQELPVRALTDDEVDRAKAARTTPCTVRRR